MKNAGLSWLVKRAGFPIARHAAADSNHAAQNVRVREREAIIQRARLREAEQEDLFPIGDAFLGERVDQIEQRAMMNRDGFFGPKVCRPAKADPQWPTGRFWFAQMLMRTLQRSDGEPLVSDGLRLAQRVPLAGAIAVQRNQQRRRPGLCRHHVVIEFDFACEGALKRGCARLVGLVAHRQIRLIARPRKSNQTPGLCGAVLISLCRVRGLQKIDPRNHAKPHYRVASCGFYESGSCQGRGSVDRLTLLSELPSWPLISGVL